MLSHWGSTFVALALIAGFYFFRRSYGRRTSFLKKELAKLKKNSNSKKSAPPKVTERTRAAEKAVPIFSKPAKAKKKRTTEKLNPEKPASLLLHPHSLEQGKREYLACAPFFQGLYERLYQGAQGNMSCAAQTQLIQDWESKIMASHSEHLMLVWVSIVHRHAGKKLYGRGEVHKGQPLCSESALLKAWLKQLKEWGLQRISETGPACWMLEQNIIEQETHEVQKSH